MGLHARSLVYSADVRLVLGLEASKLCVTPSEIGGGFGGKTTIFIEPLALALEKLVVDPLK